jgi:hypothetical protein
MATNAAALSRAPALPPPANTDASAFEEVQVLGGHSGARVTLCRRGENSLVRKRAGARAGNVRLLQQAIKQKLLASSGVPFPKVVAQGTEPSGLAYFEMDYVPARTLASVITDAASYDRAQVLSGIDGMLWLFRAARGEALSPDIFRDEIVDVGVACGDRAPCRPHHAAIRAMRDALVARSWSRIPGSPSHGDLTLENILLSQRDGLVFIDCEEAFASSFWLDVGKLFQDVYGYWCLRNLLCAPSPGAELLKAIHNLEQLGQALRALAAAADPALPARLPQLAALHLFRTLPYAEDEAAVSFVLARTRHVIGMQR